MSIHSGSPHILIFERDQQLTALLMSEFQLAGYECHAARTAVEVFDAIARFPVRLVLVNLAQAAAGRREFWVALDAQRRGRGVQVFTFRCMNIAGYGVDDPDERARIVLTDMEVDGMLGVMNLVDAVRTRIPASSTGSFSRVNPASQVRDSARLEAIRPASQPGFAGAPAPSRPATAQATAPLSMLNDSSSSRMPAVQPAPAAPPVASIPPFASQQRMASPNVTEQAVPPRIQPSTFTDKIRAVIRPGNRGVSTNPEANWVPYSSPEQTQRPTRTDQPEVTDPAPRGTGAGIDPAQPMQSMPPAMERAAVTYQPGEESGLAQLSRMVRENVAPYTTNGAPGDGMPQARAAIPSAPVQPRPGEPPSLGEFPLRASPIEDLPGERLPERRNGAIGASSQEGSLAVESTQDSIAPTLHLTVVNPPVADKPMRVGEVDNASTPSMQLAEEKQPGEVDNAPTPSMKAVSYTHLTLPTILRV